MFTTAGGALVLGRAKECSIVLATDGVSRNHALIEYRRGQYWLQPNDTLNGTRINGELVHQTQPLVDGDQVGICDHVFLVFYGEPTQQQVRHVLSRSPPPAAAPAAPQRARATTTSPISPAPAAAPATSNAVRWILAIVGLVALIAGVVVATVTLMKSDRTAALAPAPAPERSEQAPVPAPEPVADPAPVTPAPRPAVPTLAVLEPSTISEVAASSSGTVTEAVPAGTRVKRGARLVSYRERSDEASRARVKLRDMQRKYGASEEHADFLARAKEEYARARAARRIVTIVAPVDGVVLDAPPAKGRSVRTDAVVTRIAARARLLVSQAAIEGTGTACRAEITEPAVTLEGTLDAASSGGKRSLQLAEFPAALSAGAVVQARLICAP